MPPLGLLLVLVAVGGALSCLVLASCWLVLSRSKLIDRPFGLIVCCLSFPFLVYFTFFSLVSVTHPQANVGLVCRIPVPLVSLTHSI